MTTGLLGLLLSFSLSPGAAIEMLLQLWNTLASHLMHGAKPHPLLDIQ
jgi:hypothetical protein